MQRVIGINVPFLTPKREEKLRDAAKAAGFEIRILDDKNLKGTDVSDCEVLFGVFPKEIMQQAKSLKWFHCSFAGVDKYTDSDTFADAGVVMSNSSGAYGITISEHLVCVLLMMMRRMPEYMELQRNEDWYCVGEVRSIFGSTITIVGVGDIGGNLARRIKPMGAFVRGVRRTQRPKPEYLDEVYLSQDMDKAIDGADVVVLCVPGTEDTQKIMTDRRFKLMKKGSMFINVGRGNAVDQKAMEQALRSGHLSAAAIDVAEVEPLPKGDSLWSAPGLIITPHVSGNMSLPLTCDIITDMFIDNLHRYAEGKELKHKVDRKAGY